MGSLRMDGKTHRTVVPESSCSYLLQELKMIWDEVGQEENERERILEELQQECQEVYRRKVNSANVSRIQLHQALAESEAEFTNLLLSLGERSSPGRPNKMTGTLKEQLNSITPALQEMQMRKEARVKQFIEVRTEVQRIASEIAGCSENEVVTINEDDLSLKKLEEHQSELHRLKREKGDRLCKVEEYKVLICNFARIMGMDLSIVLANVHPSLLNGANEQQTKNISDDILNKLNTMVQQLKEEKNHRMEKLHSLGKALTNLWSILDTTMEDRQQYGQIDISSKTSGNGMLSPGSLTLEKIQQIESEVQRLDQLKAGRMKELFIKKKTEIEEICKASHMDVPYQIEMNNIMHLIISGKVDHNNLLKTMDGYIYKTKEEATSRKEIMEKVEKWIASCDEERWLEEYSRDERRYSVSRGAHKNLKRAEHARIQANKIPGLVELLMAKTAIWEQGRNKVFYYDEIFHEILLIREHRNTGFAFLSCKFQQLLRTRDKETKHSTTDHFNENATQLFETVHHILMFSVQNLPLLAMLKDYMLTAKEKEEERYRQRENKKVQTQLVRRNENPFILRPSTSCSRPSSRGFNTSHHSTTLSSGRSSSIAQQTISDNSAEKDVHIGKVRNRSTQSTLGNNRSCSIPSEDKTSRVLTKQGLPPI